VVEISEAEVRLKVPMELKELAKETSPDPKDIRYFALASIFSGDKTLKRLSPVKVLSPREVLKLL